MLTIKLGSNLIFDTDIRVLHNHKQTRLAFIGGWQLLGSFLLVKEKDNIFLYLDLEKADDTSLSVTSH